MWGISLDVERILLIYRLYSGVSIMRINPTSIYYIGIEIAEFKIYNSGKLFTSKICSLGHNAAKSCLIVSNVIFNQFLFIHVGLYVLIQYKAIG